MRMRYRDRADAGVKLAAAVRAAHPELPGGPGLVLGVPRGGVVVAAVVAKALDLELDVVVARKLGAPANPELAVGAIAAGGARWINRQLLRRLGLDDLWVEAAARREEREIERRAQVYRGERPAPVIADRPVIVVDDGVATGATIVAVLETIRLQHPSQLVCAVPVAPPDAVALLSASCDSVVCPLTPSFFEAVGSWFGDFRQTSDDEVIALLRDADEADDRRR